MKSSHKTKVNRRLITALEWGAYLKVSRHTVKNRIEEYQSTGAEYDPRDIYSVLRFHSWLIAK